MTLNEEGEMLKAAVDAARNKKMQATAEYAAALEAEYSDALDAYDKFLDRSIEAINLAQRAIRELP